MPNGPTPGHENANQDRTFVQGAVGFARSPSITHGGPGALIGAIVSYGITNNNNIALIIGGMLIGVSLILEIIIQVRGGR